MRMAAKRKLRSTKEYWSAHVTETSDALDIPGGTFAKDDPKAIAHELERDAEKSKRRKSSPYRSAMSMLTFYINRAGKKLPAARKKILEDAKQVLREEFGPQRAASPGKKSAKKSTAKAATGKKKTARKPAGRKKKTTRKRA
jgi:Protein of unknown function (DUF3175)